MSMKKSNRLAAAMILIGFGSLAHGAATTTFDYAVATVPGGINLYAITNKGVVLVQGSPFVANNPAPPVGIYTGMPVQSPTLLQMDATHEHVYALYATDTVIFTMLAGWKITPRGLVQQFGTITDLHITGNHSDRPGGLSIQGGFEVLYYGGESGTVGDTAEIYNTKGQLVNRFSGGSVNGPVRQALQSVVIDPTGQSLSGCFLGDAGGSNTSSVDVFDLKSGKLIVGDSDPDFANAICTE
jgi:hypothetical protein